MKDTTNWTFLRAETSLKELIIFFLLMKIIAKWNFHQLPPPPFFFGRFLGHFKALGSLGLEIYWGHQSALLYVKIKNTSELAKFEWNWEKSMEHFPRRLTVFGFHQHLQLLSTIFLHGLFSQEWPMPKASILVSVNKLPANKVNLGNFPLYDNS